MLGTHTSRAQRIRWILILWNLKWLNFLLPSMVSKTQLSVGALWLQVVPMETTMGFIWERRPFWRGQVYFSFLFTPFPSSLSYIHTFFLPCLFNLFFNYPFMFIRPASSYLYISRSTLFCKETRRPSEFRYCFHPHRWYGSDKNRRIWVSCWPGKASIDSSLYWNHL